MDKVTSFFNSVAYHVGDVPMLDMGEAQRTIDEWKKEGVYPPSYIDADVLYTYHQDTLCARYPISTEPLAHNLDRRVFEFLRDEGWDFRDGLEDQIDYINAWYSISDWREVAKRDGYEFPQFLTPEVFMRYVNSHNARLERCRMWIIENVEDKNGQTHTHWHGPFERLDFLCRDPKERNKVVYRYTNAVVEDDEISVDEWHSIEYRDPGFVPPC